MAETFLQLPVDTSNTGKKIRYNSLVVGADTVHALGVYQTDPNTAANVQAVTAKGVQGSFAAAVQDLKDSGRTLRFFRAVNFTTATTEALITLTPNSGGTDGSTGTSFTVTSGKTLRLLTLILTTRNAGAAIQGPIVKVRITATGAVAASSPVIGEAACQTPAATAAHVAMATFNFPEGTELSGTNQIGISQLGIGAVAGNDVVLVAYEY